jgi:DNA-binding winged helix-turn-helix (wHTH) protein/TolB-like protein
MPRSSHEIHFFGSFALDLTRGSLRQGSDEIKLRPKSFEVLRYLVKHSGRLIGKDELIKAAWGGTAVTDDSLVQCLKDIRHALTDEEQRIVKTVHGRGYIFDAEVSQSQTPELTLNDNSGVRITIEELETDGDASMLLRSRSGTGESVAPPAQLHRRVRLMVLPFRMLRPDSDVEFLAFSVPDAVAGALSVLDSVVVRSPAGAAAYANDFLDLKRVAIEARSDAVLTGTILRSGKDVRVSCELVEVPSGSVLWWDEPHVDMSDLFELQDNLVRKIVESLSLSLSAVEYRRLRRDVPVSSFAYESYLRANELSRRGLAGHDLLAVARDLYVGSVETDPLYAPAWAQLGRCYRLIGKGMENGIENLARAESAFQRALQLNPDLPVAHSQYAFLEAELGRAQQAVTRLLKAAQVAAASPDIFVALVLCCRFCGLLEASLNAHERARELDPQVQTSVSHTYYQLGDYDAALTNVSVGAWAIQGMTLGTVGRTADATEAFRNVEKSGSPAPMRTFVTAWRAMFEDKREESLMAAEQCIQHYLDPEGVFYMGLIMARLGESARALTVLSECMSRGFCSPIVLQSNGWFDPLRQSGEFKRLLEEAKKTFDETYRVYRSADGPAILAAHSVRELDL